MIIRKYIFYHSLLFSISNIVENIYFFFCICFIAYTFSGKIFLLYIIILLFVLEIGQFSTANALQDWGKKIKGV